MRAGNQPFAIGFDVRDIGVIVDALNNEWEYGEARGNGLRIRRGPEGYARLLRTFADMDPGVIPAPAHEYARASHVLQKSLAILVGDWLKHGATADHESLINELLERMPPTFMAGGRGAQAMLLLTHRARRGKDDPLRTAADDAIRLFAKLLLHPEAWRLRKCEECGRYFARKRKGDKMFYCAGRLCASRAAMRHKRAAAKEAAVRKASSLLRRWRPRHGDWKKWLAAELHRSLPAETTAVLAKGGRMTSAWVTWQEKAGLLIAPKAKATRKRRGN